MTTNKNKIATAPTYTISIIMPKNSAPIIMNSDPTEIKHKIRKKTELTVFLESITNKEANTVINEKK